MNTKILLKNAWSALNNNDIKSARNSINKIKGYNKNPESLYILALCHAINYEFSKAESMFSNIINISSPSDALLGNLGLAQLHQNKIEDAIKSFLDAIKINPENYDALVNLSSCYDHLNNLDTALVYANKANIIKPDNPVIINIMAKHALSVNDLQTSIMLYNRSITLQANQPQTYANLANIYHLTKNYDAAENILIKALKILVENPYLLNSLGNFYASRNQHQKAIKQFDKILDKNNSNTAAIAAKAHSLIALQQFDQAYDNLIKAYHNHPESPEIITELCNYYILNKKYESAYNVSLAFIKTLKDQSLTPGNIALAHSTACQHTSRLKEARDILENAIDNSHVTPEILETIYFSKGDILDSINLYDEAFENYKCANEIIPRPSDINYYENVLTGIENTVNRPFLDKVGTSNNQSSLPIFIVGMPRSGTSLVEQIISCHPQAYGAGELSDLWKIGNTISNAMNMLDYTKNFSTLSHEQLVEFSQEYLTIIKNLAGDKTRVTDKLPHNFMHIGLIECLFPKAKIIHCQRHPFDTCLSIYFKKFNDNHVYARNLEELARFYKKYMALMEHWDSNSTLSILTVKYEDMVLNQETESQKIIKHINLDWSDEVLRYHESDRIIMTPSYHQASKPIYTDSMYRWRNYRNHLQPLINILGDPEQYTE